MDRNIVFVVLWVNSWNWIFLFWNDINVLKDCRNSGMKIDLSEVVDVFVGYLFEKLIDIRL